MVEHLKMALAACFTAVVEHLNMALAAPLGLRRASHDGWAKSQHAHWACTRTAEAVGVMLTHAFILDAANSDRERVETLEVDLPT